MNTPAADQSFSIVNARLVMPDQIIDGGTLVVRQGRIVSAGLALTVAPTEYPTIDADGKYLVPGFVDIHVHGGAGSDFMDGTREAFQTVLSSHLRHGTTSVVPTNTVGRHERIMQFLSLVRDFKAIGGDAGNGMPRVPGCHLYGPYFAEEKIGCHPHDARPPTEAEYQQYLSYADCMLLATCAPELLRFPLKMLGVDRVALVTDCSRAMDMPPGEYVFGPHDGGEAFYNDGTVGLTPDRKGLASSVRGMDFMVRQMVQSAGVDLITAVRMASLTPATILGVENDIGSLAPGKCADFLMLDATLQVRHVWVGGKEWENLKAGE